MLESRPFIHDDISGVVACLKRNYGWMGEKSDDEITDWFSVLSNHFWKDGESDKNRYNYGKVLLDKGKIVGYFGGIGAERSVGDNKYLFMNFSTWAVDKEFRGFFFKHVEDLYKIPDVLIDLTPNPGSIMFESKFFDMKMDESGFVRLFPIPYTGKKKLDITYISNCAQIDNYVIKKEFEDHNRYKDIGLIRVEDEKGVCYVFYRRMHGNGEWIRILKVSDSNIFAKYCHEIIWSICEKESYSDYNNVSEQFAEILRRSQDKTWIAVECEKRFFGGNEIDYPLFTEIKKKRLYKNNNGLMFDDYDFLYTEYAFLV